MLSSQAVLRDIILCLAPGMVLLTLLDFICLQPVQERYHLSQPLKSAQIVPSYSPGCCLPDPSSHRDCEAETTSRSCFSWPCCCQIHNQLRGPTSYHPHCFPIFLCLVLQLFDRECWGCTEATSPPLPGKSPSLSFSSPSGNS